MWTIHYRKPKAPRSKVPFQSAQHRCAFAMLLLSLYLVFWTIVAKWLQRRHVPCRIVCQIGWNRRISKPSWTKGHKILSKGLPRIPLLNQDENPFECCHLHATWQDLLVLDYLQDMPLEVDAHKDQDCQCTLKLDRLSWECQVGVLMVLCLINYCRTNSDSSVKSNQTIP